VRSSSLSLPMSLAAVAYCAASVALSSTALDVTVPKLEGKIILDGSPVDWEGASAVYLEESVRIFAARHDDEYLYVMFRFGDDRLARRVRGAGVTLWLDGAGGSDAHFGVRYAASKALAASLDQDGPEPGTPGPEPSGGTPPSGSGGEDRPPDEGGHHKPHASPFAPPPGTLTIVRPDDTESRPESGADGLAAASAVTDGSYCYELRIPLAMIPGLAAPKAGAKLTMSLGVQIGGLSESERKAMKEKAGERHEGKGGGGEGGFEGGGGYGDGGGYTAGRSYRGGPRPGGSGYSGPGGYGGGGYGGPGGQVGGGPDGGPGGVGRDKSLSPTWLRLTW
jgi:hypothetical protein